VSAPEPIAGSAISARRARSRWASLLSLAVMAILFAFLARKLLLDWESVKSVPWRVEPFRLLLSFALLGVYYPLLVWTWCLLMRQLGQPVPFRAGLCIWLGSQLGKYLPGKVWSLIGRVVLGERAGLDSLRVSVSLVIEIGLNIVAGLLVAAAAIAVAGGDALPGRNLILFSIPIGLIVLHPRIFEPLVHRAMRVLKRPDLVFHWSAAAQYRLVVLYVIGWILYGGALYLLVDALDVAAVARGSEAPLGRVLFILGANALAWTVGFLAFLTPNGLGVREATLAFVLKTIMPASVATLVSLIARVWITVAEGIIVAAGWWIGRGAVQRLGDACATELAAGRAK
jgi:uncharacterized membrane protein YbhN (UPF0104 family)